MTTQEIKIRIEKKEQEIAKMEKNLVKYEVSEEFTAMCDRYFQTKDHAELDAYKKAHNLMWLPEYYSKRYCLEDAKETLAKYHKQLEAQVAKENTLNEIPEAIKEFGKNLENRWNEYDMWKKQSIREDCKKEHSDYREFQKQMNEKWGRGWYEFAYYTTDEQIQKNNKNAVDALILNLVTRTVEITGQITDAKYLRVESDNNGYSIINGIVIGEKGKARVESIGAGGYNIQRYHIRVLVKEVRA